MAPFDSRLTPAEYLDHVRADAALLRAAVADAPTAPVPDVPDWTALTVLAHVGDVYKHKVEALRQGHPPDPWPPARDEPEPFAWFDSSLAELLAELESRPADEPTWTWFAPDQTVGFWHRRMAHETAVHRQDAEGAAGQRTPIDDALAVDGIDELLGFLQVGPGHTDDLTAVSGIVELTSGPGTWRLAITPRQLSVVDGGDQPAGATVDGTPDAVLRWLWRGEADGLAVTGDPELVVAVRAHITAVMG